MTHKSKAPTVSIGGVDLSRIEYQGEQVVTFAQVDRVHERPEGTAGRTFRENRERFVEGEDFVTGNLDAMRRAFPGAFPARGGGDVTLITRRGYLKLVKPMSDDRAWAVQGEMIDRYFSAERLVAAAQRPVAEASRVAQAREARLTFNGLLRLCKMAGVTGNHALIAANGGTRDVVGVDYLGALGMPRLASDAGGAQMTVTDVGRPLGLSDRETNKALTRHQFQTVHRSAKGRLVYEPTAKGEQHGGRMAMPGTRTARFTRSSSGTTARRPNSTA